MWFRQALHGDLHFPTEGGGHIPSGNDDFRVGMRFNLTSIILVAGRLFDRGPIQMKCLFIFSLVAIAPEPILKQLPRSSAGHFCSAISHQKLDTVHCYQNLLLSARQRHDFLHLVMSSHSGSFPEFSALRRLRLGPMPDPASDLRDAKSMPDRVS